MPYPSGREVYSIRAELFDQTYDLDDRERHTPTEEECLAEWAAVLKSKAGTLYRSSVVVLAKNAAAIGNNDEVEETPTGDDGDEHAVIDVPVTVDPNIWDFQDDYAQDDHPGMDDASDEHLQQFEVLKQKQQAQLETLLQQQTALTEQQAHITEQQVQLLSQREAQREAQRTRQLELEREHLKQTEAQSALQLNLERERARLQALQQEQL